MAKVEITITKFPDMAKKIAEIEAGQHLDQALKLEEDIKHVPDGQKPFLEVRAKAHRIVTRAKMGWPLNRDQYLEFTNRICLEDNGLMTYREFDD